ncbi:hypothetical protein DITRI_Ditri07aG0019800 [Diplodiscus trichospermus]
MAFIAVVIISLQTMLYLFNVFSITPLITNLIMKQTYKHALAAPGTPEFAKLLTGLQKDVNIFLVVELIFLLISLMVSFFLLVSTTYASALIHGGQVTSEMAATVLSVPVTVFYTYLSVVWDLALVVSIVEGKMGIEALGKAAQIVKAMKLQGFILNLLLTIISLILMQCFRLISKIKQPEATQIVISMVAVSLAWMGCLGNSIHCALLWMQENSWREVELQAPDVEYTKIPTFAPLVSDNMP